MCQLVNEQEVAQFHKFIEQLCDPDSKIVADCQAEKFPIVSKCCFDNECKKNNNNNNDNKEQQETSKFVKQLSVTVASNECQVLDEGGFRIRGKQDEDTDFVFEGHIKDSLPHGFFRKLNQDGDIEFFGCFLHGQLYGNCWKSLTGGGFVVSDNLEFGGNQTVYLYPDCRTALVGSYSCQGRLVAGQVAEVTGIQPFQSIIMLPRLSRPQPESPTFTYDPSSSTCISKSPLLQDPYEDLFVTVGSSLIPEAGQGLFAKVDLDSATVISFYNGLRYKSNKNNNNKDHGYKLNLNPDTDIDIPPQWADTANYTATLGHKICHSFAPNCEFDNFEHPRFGNIKCIVTLRPVPEGEELTADYQYDLSVAPCWYKKLWAKHQKRLRGMPSWQTALAFRNVKIGPKLFFNSSNSSNSSSSSSRTISESWPCPDIILEEADEDTGADADDEEDGLF